MKLAHCLRLTTPHQYSIRKFKPLFLNIKILIISEYKISYQ